VRWRRSIAIQFVGLLAIGALGTQMAGNRIMGLGGLNLVVQGQKAQFNTAKLSTTNVGFGIVPLQARTPTGDATKYALRMGFANGSLDGFCLSQSKDFGGILGTWTIRLTSRDNTLNSFDVTGHNVQFDVTQASSAASPNTSGNGIKLSGNVALGVSTQTITTWQSGGADVPNPLDAPEDYSGIDGRLFAIDSDVGDLYNLKGDIYDAIIQGPINIKNLTIEVLHDTAANVGCKNISIVY
jgi:hypothetical protein